MLDNWWSDSLQFFSLFSFSFDYLDNFLFLVTVPKQFSFSLEMTV